MGANNVLPTIPTFSDTAPSLADLNNLSYAVSFLTDVDTRPAWKIYTKTTQSLTANSWHAITLASVALDSDGVADGTGITIVTQGFYALTAMAQIQATGSQFAIGVAFNATGKGNNPHLASGATLRFGERGDSVETAVTTNTTALVTSTVTPICMYPGDTIRMQVYTTAAATHTNNVNTTYQQGRFAPNFTGYLARLGT